MWFRQSSGNNFMKIRLNSSSHCPVPGRVGTQLKKRQLILAKWKKLRRVLTMSRCIALGFTSYYQLFAGCRERIKSAVAQGFYHLKIKKAYDWKRQKWLSSRHENTIVSAVNGSNLIFWKILNPSQSNHHGLYVESRNEQLRSYTWMACYWVQPLYELEDYSRAFPRSLVAVYSWCSRDHSF